MASEEEEVTLVVQGHNLAASELRLRREERAEHSADRISEESGKAVENQLRYDGSAGECDGETQTDLRVCDVALA